MKTQQGILLFNTPPHLPVPPKNGLLLSFLLKYYLKYWHRTYSSSDLTMILHFRNVSISLFSPLFSFRRIFSLISCLKSQRKIFRQEIVSIKKKLGLGWNDSGINWKRYSFIYWGWDLKLWRKPLSSRKGFWRLFLLFFSPKKILLSRRPDKLVKILVFINATFQSQKSNLSFT